MKFTFLVVSVLLVISIVINAVLYIANQDTVNRRLRHASLISFIVEAENRGISNVRDLSGANFGLTKVASIDPDASTVHLVEPDGSFITAFLNNGKLYLRDW